MLLKMAEKEKGMREKRYQGRVLKSLEERYVHSHSSNANFSLVDFVAQVNINLTKDTS